MPLCSFLMNTKQHTHSEVELLDRFCTVWCWLWWWLSQSEDLLWNDFEEKINDQIVRTMENYTSQFPEVKVIWSPPTWTSSCWTACRHAHPLIGGWQFNLVCVLGASCKTWSQAGGLRLSTTSPGSATERQEKRWSQNNKGCYHSKHNTELILVV